MNSLGRSIRDVQQTLAESSGYKSKTIWDLLTATESEVLKVKIKELIPDQVNAQKQILEMRQTLFRSIWAQRKYTNGNSLTAIIYVFVMDDDSVKCAADARKWTCHPVFRARRCVKNANSNDQSTEDCCMIFIDETGRVYQNWKCFLQENVLPKSRMVAPKNGIYTFDANGQVELVTYYTPATLPIKKLINAADTTAALGGFAAVCVPLVISAPAVISVALFAGLVTNGYALMRSAGNLSDRARHEQPNDLTDRHARSNWLALATGAIGFSAMKATSNLTKAAASGRNISLGTRLLVDGMNISSIVLSGTGVANGILDIILKYEEEKHISGRELVQMSASLVLFTHSVKNFRLASKMITQSQQYTVASYRSALSNRQRRIFDKMAKETIRVKGIDRASVDIIRTVNDIGDTKFLNDLNKVNKQLNQRNIRPSFGGADKGILLNNEVSVDTAALRANLQHNVGTDITGLVTKPIPPQHKMLENSSTSTKLYEPMQLLGSNNTKLKVDEGSILAAGVRKLGLSNLWMPTGQAIPILKELGQKTLEHVLNAESFETLLLDVAKLCCETGVRLIMSMLRRFIETKADELHRVLNVFISSETALRQMVNHISREYGNYDTDFLRKKEQQILRAIENWFKRLHGKFSGTMIKCDTCKGSYNIVNL